MRRFLLPTALFALVLLALWPRRHAKPTSVSAPALPKNVSAAAPALPKPRATPAPAMKPGPAISPACLAAWTTLRQLDLSKFSKEKPTLPDFKSCGGLPPDLASLQSAYTKACLDKGKLAECASALLAYRAAATEAMTSHTPLDQISDPAVLGDKLLAEYRNDPAKAAAVADRMLELDDKNYPAAKASAMGHFQELMQTSPDASDPRWEKWMRSLDRARELAPAVERGDLAEMEVVAKVRLNEPEDAKQIARELGEQGEAAVGQYLLAGIAYKQGDRAEARASLQKAVALQQARQVANDPQLERFTETLRRLDAGEEPVFTYAFNFATPLAPATMSAR